MDWGWSSEEKGVEDENPSSSEEDMFDHLDRQTIQLSRELLLDAEDTLFEEKEKQGGCTDFMAGLRLEPQGHAATGEVESLAAVSPYSTITDDRFEPPKHETAGEWRRRFPYLKVRGMTFIADPANDSATKASVTIAEGWELVVPIKRRGVNARNPKNPGGPLKDLQVVGRNIDVRKGTSCHLGEAALEWDGQCEELLDFRTQGKRAELLQSLRVVASEPQVLPADPAKVLKEDVTTLCLEKMWKDVLRNNASRLNHIFKALEEEIMKS